MKKLKWISIWFGMKLLKSGLSYRIRAEQQQWLQEFPASNLVNRNQFLLECCRNRSVLHIGFADAPFTRERLDQNTLLHSQIKQVASFVWGIDPNTDAVNIYKNKSGDENVFAGTLKEFRHAKEFYFDLVLAGEVLEHIADPVSFIADCTGIFKKNQELILTVPNSTSLDSIAASLNGTESIHKDHHWYFSPYTLIKKFDTNFWELTQFTFGVYGNKQPNFIQKQFPATGDCIIAVFKRK
jgi:hypothetical protein